MTQVAIVGAGPTGTTLALLLAQLGIQVKLIEAASNFRRTFRGEALMPSGLEAIEQMGLADLVAQIPHRPLDAWAFHIENRQIFQVQEPLTADGRPCTLISQADFLAGAIDRASKYPAFELVQGSAVRQLLQSADRVTGVQLADGREIVADLVIGADGRNSVVRQQANLSLQVAPQDFDILWFKLPYSQELDANPLFAQNIFHSILQGRHAFGLFRGATGDLQIGWSLHRDDPDWQQVDWPQQLVAAAPPWLAAHLRSQAAALTKPLLLSIVVGSCPQWQRPGLLLLGDAAHPMSPIRAQGINMALRDVMVAVNCLAPLLQKSAAVGEIDLALQQIQAERQPEIARIQQLQAAEVAQARLLRNFGLLRHGVSRLAPVIGWGIQKSWLHRQVQLRQGCQQILLNSTAV
jgi:2-polyprenyl-6-methoxyphenol hydroxylase-like FAD-dependent oxidoreductase